MNELQFQRHTLDVRLQVDGREARQLSQGVAGSAAIAFGSNGDTLDDCTSEQAFYALLRAFKKTGGIKRGNEIRRTPSNSRLGGNIALGRLLDQQSIFGFQWRSAIWVPMFQFGQADLSIHAGSYRVRTELGDTFDGWDTCCWFAEPNSWLSERRPVDLLESDILAVIQAARADRFVVSG